MIHCAIMGSIERFSAVLIEHLGGNFPLWLSPEQIRILTVSDKHAAYAQEIYETLRNAGIRAEIDKSDESLGKKIRAAKTERLPYFLVLGDKEVENREVTLEVRGGEAQKMSISLLVEKLERENTAKALT